MPLRPSYTALVPCTALLIAVAGCSARHAGAPSTTPSPRKPAAQLASIRELVNHDRILEAATEVDRLLEIPLGGPVRSEALELAAFVRAHPTPGVQDLSRARGFLIERRGFPSDGRRRVELEAVLSVIESVLSGEAAIAEARNAAAQATAQLSEESAREQERTAAAAKSQRQLKAEQTALRAQVQALSAEVQRLQDTLKRVAAGVVGGKRRDP